jgi:hypothetical protein
MVGFRAALCLVLAGRFRGRRDDEELPIAYGARVTFFAGPKKVTKETAWLSPVRDKS